MHKNFIERNANEALPRILQIIERDGHEITSRNGGCQEITHVGITLTKPWQREIFTPHRKPSIAAQIAETMWVLAGRSDIDFLKEYLPRAADFSDDGLTWRAGYGERIRQWGTAHQSDVLVDQWAECVRLLKEDPSTRRAVMSIWDPALDYAESKDIPCNNWLSWSSRLGYLDLMVSIRSNDAIWGWSGINAFEWSALLEVTAGLLGLEVGCLHFATTSLHVYEKHYAKAHKIIEDAPAYDPRIQDSPRFSLPLTKVNDRDLETFDGYVQAWFQVEKIIRTGDNPTDTDVDSLVNRFGEPMLQSWLRVLQWWWSGDLAYIEPLAGTRLEAAVHASVAPPQREEQTVVDRLGLQGTMNMMTDAAAPTFHGVEISPGGIRIGALPADGGPPMSPFLYHVITTHNEKHAAYGDSWKRRGEMLGIMANIARKVDRLGGTETSDETSADTALDLFVYLCKYYAWLAEEDTDSPDSANDFMREIEHRVMVNNDQPKESRNREEDYLRRWFDILEQRVVAGDARWGLVADMAAVAYVHARSLFEAAEYRGADVD